jgi:hypothetical protein
MAAAANAATSARAVHLLRRPAAVERIFFIIVNKFNMNNSSHKRDEHDLYRVGAPMPPL